MIKHSTLLLTILFCSLLCIGAAPPAHMHNNEIMSASVRINNRLAGASSGVIIRAQKEDKYTRLWILSTGHMHDRIQPEIEIFYRDNKLLKNPIFVKGQISLLVMSNLEKGIDFSVIYAEVDGYGFSQVPLAPAKFAVKKNDRLLSVGCDLGIEPKCFNVTMMNYRKKRGDFYVRGESKVGRSGGGIFTADGKYVVGVCWGGYTNTPKSMFTNHKVILALIEQTGVIK